MKKLVSFVLALSMLLFVFSPVIAATDKARANTETNYAGAVQECYYDTEIKQIIVSGTIGHDIFITHKNCTVELYKISYSQNLSDVVSSSDAIASTSASIKFSFAVDVHSTEDIFSRYSVILLLENGEYLEVNKPTYPLAISEYNLSTSDKSGYKGMTVGDYPNSLDGASSTAVIDVEFDRLEGSSSGYVYMLDGNNIFFDKRYIDEIDLKVKELSATGARVYLRFLMNGTSMYAGKNFSYSAIYSMPDIKNDVIRNVIFAYSDFLSQRYSSNKHGEICGVIIGKNIDNAEMFNYCSAADIYEYSSELAMYAVVVGVGVRKNISSADIVFSFSNDNVYSEGAEGASTYPSDEIIENICSTFGQYCAEDYPFSLMIESDITPFGITNKNISGGVDVDHESPIDKVGVHNLSLFSDYVASLEGKYTVAPKTFMYMWNVPDDLNGNAICAAYAYSFYKLVSCERLSSFVVSVKSDDAFRDLFNTYKYIDTSKGQSVTEPLLKILKIGGWSELIDNFKPDDAVFREAADMRLVKDIEYQGIIGSFAYFDFSQTSNISDWYAGRTCDSITVDYGNSGYRALKADFSPLNDVGYGDILCEYEYSEVFKFTKYLSLDFLIQNSSKIDDRVLYEVKLSFGNDVNTYECTKIVASGEQTQLVFDVSSFSLKYLADYIKISIRPMQTNGDSYSLFVSSLVGYSDEYNDDELNDKITEERLKIRDLLSRNDGYSIRNNIIIIGVFVVIGLLIGSVLFVFLRREKEE